MGQQHCCQNNLQNDHELTYNFTNLHIQQPVQSSEGRLILSTATSIPTQSNMPSTKDGQFVQKAPELNQLVKTKIEQSWKQESKNDHFNFQQARFITRGENVNGFFKFHKTGIVYHGEWLYGKPNGWGQSFYPNGGHYEGSYVDGIAHGFGRLIMQNGQSYAGEIKYGRANGKGHFKSKTGQYRGQFKDNFRHGNGQQKTQTSHFKGIYDYGDKKIGVLQFNGGDIYQGQFQNNLFEGKGKLTTKQGVYEGSFLNGMKSGYGQFRWKDGSYYRGNYAQGQRQGEGEFFNSKNKSKSRGFWKNGSLEGQGEYIEKCKVYKCIWKHGKLTGLRK